MKWLGYKQVNLKSLHVDAVDIRKRTKASHVADLASNIREHGDDLIHAPTVRAESKELLCGRDRVAALMVLKVKRAWVHLVDCDDKEAKALELSENVYRRPTENRSELLAELVAIKGRELRGRIGDSVSDRDTASEKQIKVEARKQVARAAGVSVAAVKKAEQRAAAPKVPPSDGAGAPVSAAKGQGEAPSEAETTLELLGCDDSSARAVMQYAAKDQRAIDDADKYLRLAQTALAGMAPGTVQQQLHAQVHRVASLVRSHRPGFICPWCKGLPKGEFGACTPCGGAGYVSHEIAGRAPAELRNAAPPVVAIDGKFYPYAEVRDGKAKPGKNGAPKKAEKRIAVALPDGRVVDPEHEADANEEY